MSFVSHAESPVSAEYAQFNILVTYINRSPTIVSEVYNIENILEDDTNSNPISVDTIAIATDEDDLYLGLIVVSSDQSNGVWEYRHSDSTTWSPFPTDSVLALYNDSFIRFVPAADFFGSSYFRARAWDMSNNASSVLLDFMAPELLPPFSSPYSIENATISIDVLPVNDPPVITLGQAAVTYAENAAPVQIFPNISISDIDSTAIVSTTVRLECLDCDGAVSDNMDGQVSSGMSVNSGSSNDEIITLHAPPTHFIIPISSDNLITELQIIPLFDFSIASLVEYIRTLHFMNTDREPSGATRTISILVGDGRADSETVTTEIFIELVNDEVPIVTLAAATLSYIEDAGYVRLFPVAPTITDLDDNSVFPMQAAFVELVGANFDFEQLSVDCNSQPELTCSYDDSRLTITGPASVAVYEQILGNVTYINNQPEPINSPRSVMLGVEDGLFSSTPVELNIVTVLINDQLPVLEPAESQVTFQEVNPVSPRIRLAPNMTITDADSGMFPVHSVAVELMDSSDDEDEGLTLAPGYILPPFVTLTDNLYELTLNLADDPYDPSTNRTLTGIPLTVVQTFIRNVYYYNNAPQPSGLNRTVIFSVTDDLTAGGLDDSLPATVDVIFAFVDDLPTIELNNIVVVYIEGQDEQRVVLAPNSEVFDVDDDVIIGMEIVLTASREDIDISQESIFVDLTGSGSIVESETTINNSQSITLIGEGSLRTYTDIIRSLSYEHSVVMGDPDPGNRLVTVTPISTAGAGISDELIVTFNATNNAPILDLNGALPDRNNEVTFIEQRYPVLLTTSDLQLVDVDNSLIAYIDVVLSPTPDNDNETLFVDMSVSPELQEERVSRSTLRLMGPASAQSFVAVLVTLSYINEADEPNPDQRTVTVTASDGELLTEARTLINIQLVNDAPTVLLAGRTPGNRVEFIEEGAPVFLSTDPTVIDPDSFLTELRIEPVVELTGDRIESPSNLQFNSDLGYYFVMFTGATADEVEAVIASITFINNEAEPYAGDRTYCFTVIDDQQLASPSECVSIGFTFINDNEPEFNEDIFSAFVSENRANLFVFMLTAFDADSINTPTTLTYSIEAGDDCLPSSRGFFSSGSGSGMSDLSTPTNELPCRFRINSTTGEIFTTETPPDREMNNLYTLVVFVTDGEFTSFTHLEVHITDLNDNRPFFDPESYSVTVPLGAQADFTVAELIAIDPDIGTISFILFSMEPPSGRDAFDVDGETGRVYLTVSVDQLDTTVSQYILTFEALDQGFQSSTNEAIVVVNVTHNILPMFEQSLYIVSVSENIPVGDEIVVVTAIDPDENTISYSVDDERFAVHIDTGSISFVSSPDFEAESSFEFQVVATDFRGGTDTAVVRVSVEDQNEFTPVFDELLYMATICESSPLGSTILKVLATDQDGGSTGIIYYTIRSQTNCNNCVSIDNSTGVIFVAAPLDYEALTSFVVEVQAVDGGQWVSQEATVEIAILNDNEHAPEFQFSVAEVTIAENYPVGNPLPLMSRYNPLATDEDGCNVDQCVVGVVTCSGDSGLSYSIASGNVEGVFNIDASSGAIFLTRTLDLDEGEDDVFTLQLSVSDGEFNSTATLSVTIEDFNDNLPQFGEEVYSVQVLETTSIGSEVIQVNASDNDPTSRITYSLSGSSSQDFEINAYTGVVSVARILDFEIVSVYDLIVVATDGQEAVSNMSNTVAVTLSIFIEDVTDELPVLLPPFEFFVLENLPPGPVGMVLASNPNSDPSTSLQYFVASDLFTIDEYTGTIRSTESFDFEEQRQYSVRVTVQVNSTQTLQVSQNYSINVLDANDNSPIPAQDKYNVNVSEWAVVGYEVVQVEVTDADSAENGELVYSIVSGNDLGHFIIDESTGVITVSQLLDREMMDIYVIVVTISDGGTPSLSENVSICITILDEDDNAPVFVLPSYEASIFENPSFGLQVLDFPIQATDADLGPNAAINYIFELTPFENPFSIDLISGDVIVSIPEVVDREMTQQFNLVVTAFNPYRPVSTNSSVSLAITILDQNDQSPVFQQEVFTVQINEDFTPVDSIVDLPDIFSGSGDVLGRRIFTISAVDDDEPNNPNSQFEFSLLTHTDVFTIDPQSGDIYAISALDTELVNFYRLEIRATDLGTPPNSNSAAVDVSVRDINDNSPQFSQPMYSVQLLEDVENGTDVLQVMASDADIGSNAALSFSFVNADNLPFEVDPITGQISTTNGLDREVTAVYTFQVRVDDGGLPSLSDTAGIQIELVDVNDNPPIVSPTAISITLPENLPAGPLNVSFSVRDADIGLNAQSTISLSGQSSSFGIDQNGVLQVTGLLDFEAMPQWTFNVIVRNSESPFYTATAQVDVQLINLNDNPPIVNFGEPQLEYFERTKQLALNVDASISDADGIDETTLVDGIVELVGLDPREPSAPFTPNTNVSPIDCLQESNKREKFRACGMPIDSDHFFTMPNQDDTIVFTGDQYFDSSISSSFVDTGMTISTWVWVEPIASTMTIISKSSARRFYSVYCTSDFSLGFQYTDLSNTEQNIVFDNGCAMLQNEWHHLAVVVDNEQNVVSVYIDAALIGTQSISQAQDSAGNVFVGARPAGSVNTPRQDYFNGRLHLTAISNTIADQNNIDCLIGCGSALISSLTSSPLEFTYDYNRRALIIVGRQSTFVYDELLNSLVLVLPLIEPVSSSFSVSYTVQDDYFNCLPNFIDIILHPINDFVPEITVNGESLNFTTIFIEELGPVSAVNTTSLALTDRDLVAFPYKVTVTIDNPQPSNSNEVLAVSNVPSGMNVTYENYILTLCGELPLPMYESVLRTITYDNREDEPLGSYRQLRFALLDQPWDEVVVYSRIDIVLVNDLPVLNITYGNNEYSEGDGVVSVLASAQITDSDNTTLVSAIITLTALDGQLEVITVSTAGTQVYAQYNSSTTTISLTGEDTIANYSRVIETLSYEHKSDGDTTGGTRVITIAVFDGLNSSHPVDAFIFFSEVNDAPVIDLNGPAAGSNYETVFEEGSGLINISDQATLIDVDNTVLVNLTITLSQIQDGVQERIVIITPSGDELLGQQIVYPLLGGASAVDLQAVLRSSQYVNEAEEPTAGDRVIEFTASDGEATSAPVFTTLTVQTVNDRPILDIDTLNPAPGYQTSFTEGGQPVYITSRNVAITDNDDGAVVTNVLVVINNAFDLLSERIESTDPNVSITQMTVGQSRTFTITPEDPSLDSVAQLLATLVYSNALSEPMGGLRSISISVSDGTQYSNVEMVTVDIVLINEHSPQFSQDAYSGSVLEEQAAGTSVLTVFAQDMDTGSDGEVSYEIIAADPIEGLNRFEVNSSGVVLTTVALDREGIDSYTLSIRASDSASEPREDFAMLHITILDINDQTPQFAEDTLFNLLVIESREPGFVIYTLDAIDGDLGTNAFVSYELISSEDLFDVRPNGEIVVIGSLDAEVAVPVYSITVRVSDNGVGSLSSEAVFTITVTDSNDNTPQLAPTYSGTIVENTDPQVIVTVTAVDADSGMNGEVTYSFAEQNSYFSIDPVNGEISNSVQLDREERESYTFTVLAVDGGSPRRSANATVTITVSDVNDNPAVFSMAEYNADVVENAAAGTSVLTVQATDRDIGTNGEFEFSLLPVVNPLFSSNPFVIDPITGEISVNEPVDFELQPTINLTVIAIDSGATPLISNATIILTVVDENDNSPIFSQTLYQAGVLENEADATVTTVSADDADSNQNGEVTYSLLNWEDVFAVNPQSGEISTLIGLDFEATCFYRLLVLAQDNGPVRRNATALVDILVTAVNDIAPVFNTPIYSRSISENMLPGTTVAQVSATDGDQTICSDADISPSDIPVFSGFGPELGSGMEVDVALTYTLLSHNDVFTINSESGLISALVTLDREETAQYSLSVSVVDEGGLTSSAIVTVSVLDQNDNSPAFIQSSYTAMVSENAEAGTMVVQVQASDPDFIDQGRLVYSLSEPSDLFSINNRTGVITVSGAIDFDGLIGTTLRIIAIVQDTDSREVAAIVDITISDRNDIPPSIDTPPQTLTFTEGQVRLLPFPEITITDSDSFMQLCRAMITLSSLENLNSASGDCVCTDASDSSTCTSGCVEFIQLPSGAFTGNITQSSNGAMLTLDGMLSIDEYSEAIAQIEYINIISNPLPSTITITLSVFDCLLPSDNLTQTIIIQPLNIIPPVVDLNGAEEGLNFVTAFTERGPSVAIASLNATITDEDMFTEVKELTGLDVWIRNPQDSFFESLEYSPFSHPAITVTRRSPHSLSFNGVGLLSDYTAILVGITYGNSLGEPTAVARVISVQAHENHLSSQVTNTTVEFVTFNDHPPVVISSPPYENSVVTHREGGSTAITASDAFISDLDSVADDLMELEVFILTPGQFDRLYLDSSVVILSAITMDQISSTSVIFRGASSTEDYSIILRGLRYQYTDEEFDNVFPPCYIYMQVADLMFSSFAFVQLEFEPVNDLQPVFTSDNYDGLVPENATAGYSILQVTATDGDRFSSPDIVYSIIAGNEDGYFRISRIDGTIYLNQSVDFETIPFHRLTLEVEDLNYAANSAAVLNTTFVDIIVVDVNEHVPVFTMTEYNISVAEGVPIGTTVLRVDATDRDSEPHSQLQFELTGTPDFQVDTQTGIISTAAEIDRLVTAQYVFFVTVRNPGVLPFDVARVTVFVLDLDNNRPIITLNPPSEILREPETTIALAPQLRITDPDLDPSLDFALVSLSSRDNNTNAPGKLLSTVYVEGIAVSGNGTRRLEFTGESRSLPDYAQILRGVVYQDTADEPLNMSRIIVYQVGSNAPEGTLEFQQPPNEMTSEIVGVVIFVELLNDNVPMLVLDSRNQEDVSPVHLGCQGAFGSYSTDYVEDDGPVTLSHASLTITDGDSGENRIFTAFVEILNPQDGPSERLVLQVSPELTLRGHRLYIPGPTSIQEFETLLRNVRSVKVT